MSDIRFIKDTLKSAPISKVEHQTSEIQWELESTMIKGRKWVSTLCIDKGRVLH